MSLIKEETLIKPPKKAASVMKAATVVMPGLIQLQQIIIPTPAPDEVLIKLEGCGLCSSNLPPFEGRDWFQYPLEKGSLGHEGWGVVEKTGYEVENIKTGDRVSALSYHAFAEYDVAKESDVVKLPPALEDKPFPGEPLGCAMNIFERSQIQEGQTVAVIGAGFLGCLLIQLAKNKGARVLAISKRKSSLEMARECGADEIIPFEENEHIIQQVKEFTGGDFCDRVIEATGKQQPLELAGELTAIRGRLIIAGYHQDGLRKVNMQLWNWRGLDVINAHERDPQQYIGGIRKAVQAIEKEELNPYPLFTHRFHLENISKAFEALKNRPEGFIKALIMFN
ncbi:MAG: zinc-binding dehydrogenase [Balneolaceae bacterium]